MENIKKQFARLYMELDLTDDQAAMIHKLQRDVNAALGLTPVSSSFYCSNRSMGGIKAKCKEQCEECSKPNYI